MSPFSPPHEPASERDARTRGFARFWRRIFLISIPIQLAYTWPFADAILRRLAGYSAPPLGLMGGLLALYWGVWRLGPGFAFRRMPHYALVQGYIGFSIAALFYAVWMIFWMPIGLLGGPEPWGRLEVVGVALALGITGIGYLDGLTRIQLRRITIPLRGLREPLRAVQLSDMHCGPHMSETRLRKAVERVNALQPDLIFVTGDFIDFNPKYIDLQFPLLRELWARYGVWGVLGNHDEYIGVERLVGGIERHTDIHLLRDEWVKVETHAGDLVLAGIDDPVEEWHRPLGPERYPHLGDALEGRPRELANILLAHRPDVLPFAAGAGVDLVLSGHTHGGQFEIPLLPGVSFNFARLGTRYTRGLYRQGRTRLFVTTGLGVVVGPFCFGATREMVEITLQPASAVTGPTR